jgi:hypothetical protein
VGTHYGTCTQTANGTMSIISVGTPPGNSVLHSAQPLVEIIEFPNKSVRRPESVRRGRLQE